MTLVIQLKLFFCFFEITSHIIEPRDSEANIEQRLSCDDLLLSFAIANFWLQVHKWRPGSPYVTYRLCFKCRTWKASDSAPVNWAILEIWGEGVIFAQNRNACGALIRVAFAVHNKGRGHLWSECGLFQFSPTITGCWLAGDERSSSFKPYTLFPPPLNMFQ